MAGQFGYRELIRKQFTMQKLGFHILFWTFHWGIFAYGWYVGCQAASCQRLTIFNQVQTSCRPSISRPEHPPILGMDLERSWSGA